MGVPQDETTAINFLKCHIKGAKFLNLENIKAKNTNFEYNIPYESFFIRTMKNLNIKMTDHVVVYDTHQM